MNDPITFFTNSPEETKAIGQEIGKLIQDGDVLCLTGDLGAGKTTLVKGLSEYYTAVNSSQVTSPTFTYLNIYSGTKTLYHFDLYRLSSSEEFIQAGFLEFLNPNNVCCVEWPDKLPQHISLQKISISMEYLSPTQRKITFQRNYAK